MRRRLLRSMSAAIAAVSTVAGLIAAPAVAAPAAKHHPTPTRATPTATHRPATAGTAPGTFVPMTPRRLLDTRSGLGGHTPGADGTLSLDVTGRGIPATASAVALNVTVAGPTDSGFLTVYAGTAARPLASNLNFSKGQVVPNAVVAQVGTDGTVDFYNGSDGTTPLIADVSGYYLGGTVTVNGGYTPVASHRVLDTRSRTGGTAPGKNGTVHLQIDGTTGIPSDGVSAVVLNVTVTAPTAPGFVTAYADTSSRPTASNLNFVRGQTVPNLVVAPVGTNGKVALYNGSSGTTQLIADVVGYDKVDGYYNPTNPSDPGSFTSTVPARLLDTRSGLGGHTPGADGTVPLQVAGRGGVSALGVSAVALNVTVTAPTNRGFITAYADGTGRPTASNLNFVKGETVPNLVIVPVGADGKVDLYNGAGGRTQLIVDVAGYYRSDSWTPQSLAPGDPRAGAVYINGVSCVAGPTCVAVGEDEGPQGLNDYALARPLAETLTDGEWTAQLLPVPSDVTGNAPLVGVSCTSAIACVAVGHADIGDAQVPFIETLTGTTWTAQTLPALAGADQTDLSAISCTGSTTACTAGGSRHDKTSKDSFPIIETLSGSTWTGRTVGVPANYDGAQIHGISCATQATCVAVGEADRDGTGGNDVDTFEPLTETLTGASYTARVATVSGTTASSLFNAVSCPASGSCHAVGYADADQPVVATTTGASTTAQALPNAPGYSQGYLSSVSCTSATACTAAGHDAQGYPDRGDDDDGAYGPLAETLGVGSWTPDHPQESDDGTRFDNAFLYGVSCTSAEHCTAVGQHDLFGFAVTRDDA